MLFYENGIFFKKVAFWEYGQKSFPWECQLLGNFYPSFWLLGISISATYTRYEINLNFFRAFPIIYAFFLEKVHISKKSHCNVVYCHTYGRMRRNVFLLLFFRSKGEKIWNKRALFSLFDAVTWFGNHLLFEETLFFFFLSTLLMVSIFKDQS